MAWSRIQSVGVFHNGSSPSATFGAGLTSGTKLIVAVLNYTAGAHISTMTDGGSGSFTKVADTGICSGSFGGAQLWVLDTPAGDVGTAITVTTTTSGNGPYGMVCQEVSGLLAGTTGSLDGTAGITTGTQGAGSPTISSPAYSSTAVNEYLVSAISVNTNGGSFPTITPGSGTADPNNQSFTNALNCTGIAYGNSSNGAETNNWSCTGGNGNYFGWGSILVAFQLAASGTTVNGAVSALALAAPAGVPAVQAPGPVSALALAAPAGTVAVTGAATVPGAVAAVTLAAPAGIPAAIGGGGDDAPWHIRRRNR
jgi:hypothetical protein